MTEAAVKNPRESATQPLAAEKTLQIQPADLIRALTPKRLGVLRVAREEPMGVAQLARRLKRDTRAVSRDVDLLERLGLVIDTGYDKNPGHGFRRVVRPAARKITLVVTV